MSEGAAPVPSNGAATATTAPAPAVAPTSPTPTNGEGAMVPKVEAAPPKWQPIEREISFNDGTKKKYRFETQEELDRHLYNSAGFDKAQKKALELERRLKAEEAADEETLLKSRGKDPDAYFKRRLEAELARQGMTEEQRGHADAQRELQQAKLQAQTYQRALQQHLAKQQEEREWQQRAPEYRAALQAAGVTEVDDDLADELARVGELFRKAEMPWDPKAEVAEALERRRNGKEAWLGSLKPETFLSLGKSALAKLPAEAIHKALPPETLRALVQLEVEKFKASKGVHTPVPALVPKKEEPREYLTPEQWRNRPR